MAFNSTGNNLNCGFSFFSLKKLIVNCVDVFALLAKSNYQLSQTSIIGISCMYSINHFLNLECDKKINRTSVKIQFQHYIKSECIMIKHNFNMKWKKIIKLINYRNVTLQNIFVVVLHGPMVRSYGGLKIR